jgi:hypothetical protein
VSTPWRPSTEIGDVIIHHAAPRVWLPATVFQSGDLAGKVAVAPKTTRDAALTVARELLQPGRCIYIHHRDDAEWEQVRDADAARPEPLARCGVRACGARRAPAEARVMGHEERWIYAKEAAREAGASGAMVFVTLFVMLLLACAYVYWIAA